ncbi:MAG: uroporphyrinogen decarboxylase family protein [Anaerolineae bacterium]|nr:uroporphyrinogen decarboxylase family protein [Anaerolineae bacterium]
MSLEQDRIKSLSYAHPEYIPVSVGILPAAWMKYRESLDELVCSHPVIFGQHKVGERDYDAVHTGTYVMGDHVDVWGCVWSNLTTGMESIVTFHPVPTRADVRALKMPEKDAGFPHGFMYLRLLDLRGFEEIMVDFAEEPPELQMLIDTVLAYNLRQATILLDALKAQGEIGTLVTFGDDLGMQHRLAINPKKWRTYLKPCFAQIYQSFRKAGYYVYMHTDGHILEIIPDLVDCGVNVVNPQIGANGLDNLVDVCRGKVCVDLDLDRQQFPFFSPHDIDDHIHEVVDKLGSPEGGLWLKAEIGPDVPLANIAAIFNALEKYRTYYS